MVPAARFVHENKGIEMRQAAALAIVLLLMSCAPQPAPTATPTNEAATLTSLSQVDDYPLYTMDYHGAYTAGAALPRVVEVTGIAQQACDAAWGCSLFAALGDEHDRLLGRNFDWQFSPALLLFMDPPDGYASVSMVDISYLGFDGERSKHLQDLSLDERKALLDAPGLPFDGMNEKGVAIGMAAVPPQEMPRLPQRPTLGELAIIREMLDHAATVDEAIEILGSYNIDMEEVPIHYLIASASGQSAVVEFYNGEMRVFRNETDWQTATNFLLASAGGYPQGQCWRYDQMSNVLEHGQGRINSADAMALLGTVSQDNTQWSVVYHLTSGEIHIVMGRGYTEAAHRFRLDAPPE